MNVHHGPPNLAGSVWPGVPPQMNNSLRPAPRRAAAVRCDPNGCKHSKQGGHCHWRKKYFARVYKDTVMRFNFQPSALTTLKTTKRRVTYFIRTNILRRSKVRSPMLMLPKEVRRILYDKLFGSAILAVEMIDGKPAKKWIDGDLSLMFANRAIYMEAKGLLQRNTTMRLCFRDPTSTPHLLVSLLEHVDPVFLSRLEKLDIQLTSARGWPLKPLTMNDFSVLHGFSLCPTLPGRPIWMTEIKAVRILVTELQPLVSGQEIHFLANKNFACGLDVKNSYVKEEHDAIISVLRRDMETPGARMRTMAQYRRSQIKLQRRWGFRFTDTLDPEEKDFDIDSERGRKAQLHLLHADCDVNTGNVRTETWLNNWQIRKRYHYGKAVAQDDWLLVDW